MEKKLQLSVEELPKNWKWLLFLGILDLVFGILGIAVAEFLTITTTILFGILMFIAGLVQLYHYLKEKEEKWSGRLAHIIFALLYVAGGVIVFIDPVTGASALTIALAVIFILIGSMRVGLSMFLATHHWRWLQHAIGGILAIFLGVYIIIEWPISALWVIGLLISTEMILNGWQMIVVALKAKKLANNS